ncbi:MAG TPA: glycine zipper 2TM domain-containing protein [Burkholderiales bacterium]|nr:glycine zipper 2TM domain-containing protein [Burkholderiales bacterium]
MKIAISAAILLAMADAGIAAPDYTDTAQVIAATPIIERVSEPRTECFTEPASAPAPPRDRSLVGPVVGGVAGAVIGNQVGHGSGRAAATAAGAIAGTIIGDRVGNSDAQTAGTQPVQRCRTVETVREVVKGYNVVYRYNGRDITTTMPYNPGSVVRVAVGIADGPPASPPPAAPAGSNVREVSTSAPLPPPGYNYPPQPPPAPSGNTGGYQYRY